MSLGHADLLTRVKNTLLRASKIVQQVKALAATPEDLTGIPRISMVEREGYCKLSIHTMALSSMCTCMHIHIHRHTCNF